MSSLWVERQIPVGAEAAWNLLVDVERWPEWGPSVRSARLDSERFERGASGWLRTWFGVRVPFQVTAFDDGHHWAWRVAGVPATDHRVRPRSPTTCSVGFGVPWIAAPYALVCRRALTAIERLLTTSHDAQDDDAP